MMLKFRFSIFMLCVLFSSVLFAAMSGRFMQYPDINGDKIVFSYENDIWLAQKDGGLAVRLTSHPGAEYAPKISPDGKWIAFTGNYDDGNNVYVIPIDGGIPKRLTYPSGGQVVTWTPDGKKVVFRAAFENIYRPIIRLYSVSLAGELPEPLPVPRGVLCSYSPDWKKMVYNPRGREEYYWKRYKGGQYQDIWQYDFVKNEFNPVTDYVGKNSYPLWLGEKMYFVSDRGANGIANFYTYHFSTKKVDQITQYADFDVQMPSSDGQQIIYLHSGYLYLLDPATGKSQKVEVQIPTDRWQLADRTINPKDYIHSMSISNDGKTAVFEARGDVFLVPTDENEETKNLTQNPGTRERYP
ncbi:PD40 domain-containing protein, partial [candidate division KSB1 bacterium]|nr:PD40 domain-containing protein [candidate division KSB1 bacterium]